MPILEAYSFSSQHRRITLKRVPHHTRMEVTPMSTNRIRQICTEGSMAYTNTSTAVAMKPTHASVRMRNLSATMPEGR